MKETVVITYGQVSGFNYGLHSHQGNKVLVLSSYNKPAETVEAAEEARFYIYVGRLADDERAAAALDLALRIKSMGKNRGVILVTCECDWNAKRRKIRGRGIGMIRCSCRREGADDLSRLAKDALKGFWPFIPVE